MPTCSRLQQSSSLGPILCLAWRQYFLHQINVSPCLSTPLTKSWSLSKHLFSQFSKKNRQVVWSCALSWHLHVLATPSTPHFTILVGVGKPFGLMFHFCSFVIHENQPFFGFRLELSTVLPFFHQTVKASCVLQGCIHLSLTLSLVELTVFAVRSTLLRHLFLVVLCAVRLDTLHFHQHFF